MYVKLYEQECVKILLDWIPIPKPNAQIIIKIEATFGLVIYVNERKWFNF